MRHALLTASLLGLALVPACRPSLSTRTPLAVRGGPLLREVFTEIGTTFQAQHPEVDVRADFTCPPCMLTSKVREGMDLDVFVSAGDVELEALAKEGAVDLATRQPIGLAQLVLAVPEGNRAEVQGLADLNRREVVSVAMGDPTLTSPGHYARQALERMGLWREIEHKIATTKTGCEALKSLSIGTSDAAVVYAFCLGDDPARPHMVAEIPSRLHDPIILSVTRSPKAPAAAAAAFADFLTSPTGQSILRKHGIQPAPAGALAK